MGRCYGGVNTFSGSGVGPRFACGAGSDSISIAWVGALSFGKEFGPAAGLQAKKIPAEARSFFVGAQERTRTSTVLPAST